MIRVLPRTVAGQLVALLLAALLAAQVIALLLIVHERQHIVRGALREESLARAAAVVRLLWAAPADLHAGIAATASSPGLRFWVAPISAVEPAAPSDSEQELAALLAEELADLPVEPARIALPDREGGLAAWLPFGPWRSRSDDFQRGDDTDDTADDNRHFGPPRPPVGLMAAIPLPGGSWLNLEASVQPARLHAGWGAHISLAVMALAILAAAALSVRRITRPLRALASAAERLGRGEAVQPLAEGGPQEVRRTTTAFNAMQLRLSRFVQDRTRMLAAISHDLRTPITAMRLRAELVEDEETQRKLLESLDEMRRMTEATLAFAREEAAQEETRPVDLAALVSSIADDMAELGHDVTCAEAERLPYPCRPLGMKRAIRNLIENAVLYGSRARVAVTAAADGPCITIDDDGPGIAPELLDRAFEPFVRLEESRSAETGGVGLGLAIARSIVRGHGGEVTLANLPQGGLRAEIRLPRQAS